jgi:Divergent InlB B-repeat domain
MSVSRIRTIALVFAALLISVYAFVPTRGDDTPTHKTATAVSANEARNSQPAKTPRIDPIPASDDIGDLPIFTSGSAASVTHAGQSAEKSKSASADSTEATPNLAGSFFTPGNLVVAVAGCGVHGGTCETAPQGGTGTGGTYGDDQASPWTLFQYSVSGASSATFVNSLQLPQIASGANSPVSDDFGSQSEGTVQLSGNGEYLTMMGYGINAADFNINYLLYCPGSTNASNACVPENGNPAAAQTGTLTAPVGGVSGTTAVPRVAILIDPNGSVNTSTVLYNIFDENDARSSYTPDGVNIYVSGQGCKTCGPTPNQIPNSNNPFDNTMGVYYTPIGATNTAPTPITGNDNGPTGCTATTPACTASEDTRMVQIYNGTLYVSADAKPGSPGYNRSLIGTLGDPPATSQFTCTAVGGGCGTGYGPYGPALMPGFGNSGATGKYTINTAGGQNNSNGNNLNAGLAINLSPQNFWFASPTVLYVADTGSPKNHSNGPDTVCTNDGTTDSATVGDGGLQKWILNPTVTASVSNGSSTVTSATSGAFSQGQVGLPISGTDIPAGTTITAVSSAGKTATMSANATGTVTSDSITVSGWSLAYTLYNGLNLVLNVDCDPNNNNTTGTGSTGLYGVTGVVNGGVATLYVTNYPNDDLLQTYLYGITDTLSTATMTSPGTAFTLLDTAPTGSLFRGVSFAPSIPNGSVEITSVPSGLTVSTSGTGCNPGTSITTPRMQSWTPSSSCTLSVASPQNVGGVQYTFSQWQDSTTGTSDVVTAPTTTATYTATFTPQYLLTTSAASGGTISSGGYYAPGANATITATPSAGSCFVNFTAAAQEGYSPVSPSTSNPFTLQMNAPESITANFVAVGITSPASGSTLSSNAATFSWSACPDASAYYLDLGATEGSNTYLDSGDLSSSTTSYSVTDLPTNGSTVWARWYYNVNGSWSYVDSSYTASGGIPGGDTIAQMTSPTPSSTLPGSTVTFQWSTGSGPTAYWLDIGNNAGGNNYYSQNQGTATSVSVSGLPTNGSTVYVTLYSQINGTWFSNAYTYTAESVTLAQITSPTPSTTLPGSSVTFQWSTGTGATSYYLDVGTSSSVNKYYSQSQGTNTSVTVSSLPVDGSTIIVTLYSLINGSYQNNQYTYTAFNAQGSAAVMATPTPGSQFTSGSATFTWNAVTGAQAYWLDVGSTSGGNNYYSQNQGSATSVNVSTLPTNGSQVYVTLYTEFGGTWYNNIYSYTAVSYSLATMSSPSPGSPLPGPSATFTWTTGSGPTAYYLDIGSTSGGNQYYSQNEGTATSATVNSLPLDGSTVYVTLYSYLNSSWQANHYTYQAAQPAAITSPTPGNTLSGSTQTFNWNAGVSGTEYWIDIGSTASSNNLYSQDQGSSQTVTVSGLPTDGSTIYVTLYTKISGQWYNNGSVSYTTGP